MKSDKIISWEVKLFPHQNGRYWWARILPSFKKGWVSLESNALKVKVEKSASDLEIRAAVVSRLRAARRAVGVPIEIVRSETA